MDQRTSFHQPQVSLSKNGIFSVLQLQLGNKFLKIKGPYQSFGFFYLYVSLEMHHGSCSVI